MFACQETVYNLCGKSESKQSTGSSLLERLFIAHDRIIAAPSNRATLVPSSRDAPQGCQEGDIRGNFQEGAEPASTRQSPCAYAYMPILDVRLMDRLRAQLPQHPAPSFDAAFTHPSPHTSAQSSQPTRVGTQAATTGNVSFRSITSYHIRIPSSHTLRQSQ